MKRDNGEMKGKSLAITGFLIQAILLLWRIPLTNIIGDEGNGYFAVAFEIYTVFMLFFLYGLPGSVTKMVTLRESKNQLWNTKRVLTSAFLYAFLASVLGGGLLYISSDMMSKSIVHLTHSNVALQVLSVTFLFSGFAGILNGYFKGTGTNVPTTIAKILEAICVAVIGLVSATTLSEYGGRIAALLQNNQYKPAMGAAGGMIGMFAGSLIAFLFLITVYLMYRSNIRKQIHKDTVRNNEPYSQILKTLFFTSIPFVVSAFSFQIMHFIDIFLFTTFADSNGKTQGVTAISLGIYYGKFIVLANFFIAVSTAIVFSVLPSIQSSFTKGEIKTAKQKIVSLLRKISFISIPFAVALAILAEPITRLLYVDTSDSITNIFYAGSALIVVASICGAVHGILCKMNKERVATRNAFIVLVLHVISVCVFLFVLNMGVFSLVAGEILFYLLLAVLDFLAIRKVLHLPIDYFRTFAVPIISGAVMGLLMYLLTRAMASIVTDFLLVIVTTLFGVLIYVLLLIALKGITRRELAGWSFGSIWLQIAKRLRL